MKTLPNHVETLIIGAGPAGTVSAAHLARAHRDCLIIEKQQFPRFMIGESLIPQCMDMLESAGLLDAVKARNYQVKTGALFRHEDTSSEFDFSRQFSEGWQFTYHVPRDDFDKVLADTVEGMGVPIFYRHGVARVEKTGAGWNIMVEDPEGNTSVLTADFIFDASGFGHVLPRQLGLVQESTLPLRASLFTHVDNDPGDPLVGKNKITITTLPDRKDIWFWSIPFNDGRTSVGIVTEPSFLDALPEDPEQRMRTVIDMEPNIARRFADSSFLFKPRELRGYSHSVTKLHGEGFAIVGHAGEFLDPVFSSGVAVSTKSAELAAHARLRMLSGETVDWQADYADELLRGVAVFKTYVENWYSGLLQRIIYSPNKPEHYARMICSIFAGYAWDKENQLAVQHERSLPLIATACETFAP